MRSTATMLAAAKKSSGSLPGSLMFVAIPARINRATKAALALVFTYRGSSTHPHAFCGVACLLHVYARGAPPICYRPVSRPGLLGPCRLGYKGPCPRRRRAVAESAPRHGAELGGAVRQTGRRRGTRPHPSTRR